MFGLHSVLLIALDVVRGPYLHCFAPVNPFEREDAGGFSDIFVPRPEFCRRVMSLLEAGSGFFFIFYPEEIPGLHYTRKTLRYTLCFVFCVSPSLVTIGASDARRHVEPYIIVLTSIAEELRDAEMRFGFMSRGLTTPGDPATAVAASTIRANAFLSPAKDTAALAFSPLDSFVASLFASLAAADHRGGTLSVRLSTSLAFRARRIPPSHAPPPLHALDDVPVPIAKCAANAMEWADMAVRDVFRASDGNRTIADIVRLLAAGCEPAAERRHRWLLPLREECPTCAVKPAEVPTGLAETVLEALQHLEAQHYLRVVRPYGLHSTFCVTHAFGRVLCDPSHAARRMVGEHLLTVAAMRRRHTRQTRYTCHKCHTRRTGATPPTAAGLTAAALEQEGALHSSELSMSLDSSATSAQSSRSCSTASSRKSSGGTARTQGDDTRVYSEEEIEAAAAAALCALGRFTNNTILNVRREMRWIPAWRNAFAKWDEACCRALVEIAVLNKWLVEVPSAAD